MRRRLCCLYTVLCFVLCACEEPVSRTPYFAARFSPDYIAANRGQITVEVPEVYELANIIIAMTDFGLNDPYRVYKDSAYYLRVRAHFLPFRDHPAVSTLPITGSTDYYGFRENSYAYTFVGERIAWAGRYTNIRQKNLFKERAELVEDFAEVSGFRQFYRDNYAYYQQQIAEYKRRVNLRRMKVWLEGQFPQRYDSYRVIFSPLIHASHSTQHYFQDGFNECLMFVSGPHDYESDYNENVRRGLAERVVFTEIDHNYVNLSSRPYKKRIERIFKNVNQWNRQSGYRWQVNTFNEYMTWGTFLLYAHDHYSADDFEIIRGHVVRQMERSRRFIRFDEFSKILLHLYRTRPEGITVSGLYPEILEWAAKQ